MSSQTGLGEEEEEYFDAADIEDQDDAPETVEVQRKLTVYRRKYRLNPGPAVSLVLVGKVRNGKSSTGNTICGKKDLFPSSSGLRSKTKSCQLEHAIVAGREIVLVDTPGNLDTRNPAQALSEIGNAIYLQPNGYDAILLVLKWDTGITNLEKMAIEELKKLFGEHVLLQYAVLVFTHGDTYDSELPFTEFIKSQGDAYLQQLLHECQNRCVLINNKQDEASSFKDVQKLFDVVDSAREKNNGEKYTNEFFEAAKEQNEKFEQAAKEKRRELERATRAVEAMRQKNELDTLQTRKNLKDKHEEDMKLKVTEHQKRRRDKLHRQLDNEKQKYSRMIKSEMDRAEEIISFNFKQNNSFDNAYLENELKKTLEEYKATTYTGWERMIESELYHFKSNLDILYKDSDLKDHYSDTLEDNMKKFKLKVDDIQNKLRLQCSDKTTAALNVQINFLTLMKDKKWEQICKRMKSSACDTEKQTLENIRLEFEEIQRYTTGKIASFVEYKENKAESERLFWMETEIEIDIRMRKRRESLREELTQIRQEFEKSWRENTLKRILMKSRGEMLQSFEKISSEINEQFQKEIQTERRSNEMLVRGAMLKEVKVRELKDIKQYLVEESETQSRILSENLSRHVEAEQDLDLQLQELQNTVDRDIVTVKAKVEDLQKCQHDTWVKDVESQMTTACSKLEKLCKTRLEELQNLWTKLNDDKGKLWMGVFERKIDELMSDYKAKILQEFDDNIKANATKKARLKNEWDVVEKTWEIERKHTLKHEEVDWKCYVQKEFTLEGVIGRNIFECQVAMSESNLEKQITANRLRQEEEWRNICSQKMEIFLKKLDIRAKETTNVQRLAFTREQEDLRAKRLKKLKTRSQEFQLTKEKAWSDSLEDKRGIFIVKVIEELKAETDCSAVLQKRWKDHITRERKDFEVEFRKGLRCIKHEKERKWQKDISNIQREFQVIVASEMALAHHEVTNELMDDLKLERKEMEDKWAKINKDIVTKIHSKLDTQLKEDGDQYMKTVFQLIETSRNIFEKQFEIDLRKDRLSKEKAKCDEVCSGLFQKTFAEAKASCFSSDSHVTDSSFSSVPLENVKLGTEVLCYDPKAGLCFSKIYRFGHRETSGNNIFVRINTKSQVFLLSPNHHVHVGDNIDFQHTKSAITVNPGDTVFVYQQRELVKEAVLSVSLTTGRGLCHPYTHAGTIIVDGVLASCYVDRVKPLLAHHLLTPVRLLYKLLP